MFLPRPAVARYASILNKLLPFSAMIKGRTAMTTVCAV
jgi:hypothetical protein